MQQETAIPEIRTEIIQQLITAFIIDYNEMIVHYPLTMQIELTEHLGDIMFHLIRFANADGCSDGWDIVQEMEGLLLRKYGKYLAPYWNRNFAGYFQLKTVLLDKQIFTAGAFDALPAENKVLQFKEAVVFAKACNTLLMKKLPLLLLNAEPETKQADKTEEPPDDKAAFTKSRQLLAIHFLLSAGFGIEPRSGADVSSIARLCHLLTGTRFTNLQNSEIYKKYLRDT